MFAPRPRLDPEPAHAKWEYYKSKITEGQRVVPEFHCFMLRGEWWVVDIDKERQMYQQVAALEFADNPDHQSALRYLHGPLGK